MSRHNKYTTDEAARCLNLLRSHGPLKAAALASRLGIGGKRETQRRHVRAIIKHLREDCGEMIAANLNNGYFVTDDYKLWQDYLDSRSIEARGTIGKVHRQKRMVSDANGQGLLFVPGQGAFRNTAFSEAM